MRLLLKLIRSRKLLCLLTLITSGLSVAVSLWWNTQLRGIIDMVSAGRAPTFAMIVTALLTMLAMGGANYMSGFMGGYTCESMTHDLRMGYARHFALLPAAETEQLNAGEQLSKLQNEIAGVSDYMTSKLFQLLGDIVRFSATFIWLMVISPALTLAANLPALLIVIYAAWSSKAIASATVRSRQAMGQMNKYTDTLLTLFPIIRLYDAASMATGGYMSAISEWEKETVHSEHISAKLMSLSGVLSSIPLLFLFLVGGSLAISGVIGVGTLYIFINLSGNVSGVLTKMPGYITAFRQFSANMKRLEGKICLY